MSPSRAAKGLRLLVFVLALAPAGLGAAVYTISTTLEVDPENCTLRDALLAVADGGTHGACPGDGNEGPDEIVLALPDLYELDDGPITITGRELWIHGELDQPFGHVRIDLGGNQRLLTVDGGSELRLEHLSIENGSVSGRGGAVEAIDSDLTMKRVSIDLSAATEGGGAISFEATTARTLDLERVDLQSNSANGPGGALFVDLAGGGTVRLVEMRLVDNSVSEPPPGAEPRPVQSLGVFPDGALVGGALALAAAGTLSLELRHLDFEINDLTAAADAAGGGAWIFATGGGSVLAEDLYVVGNFVSEGDGNAVGGLALAVHGPSLELRRLQARANGYGGGAVSVLQARIDVGIGSAATVTDAAVVSGHRSGLAMSATGGSCSLRAANLTVAGHNLDGLALTESGGCTLTLENSIVAKNAAWGSEIPTPLDLRLSGSVTVSGETMVGGEPKFASFATSDYRLASDSPARNAGVEPAVLAIGPFDVEHGTRVLESAVDLGAWEFGALFSDDFERGDPYAWTTLEN